MLTATLATIFGTSVRWDYFVNHADYVLMTLLAAICLSALRTYRPSFCLGGGYLALSCLWHLHDGMPMNDFLLQNFLAGRTLLVMLATVVFTHLVFHHSEARGMGLLAFTNCLLTLILRYFTGNWVGAFDNPSVNSALIGVLFPYLTLWQVPVALFILFNEHGRTAWLMLTLYYLVALLRSHKKKLSWLCLMLLCLAVFYYKTKYKFVFHDRYTIWGLAMKWWWENGNIWTGQGVGAFFIQVPRLQKNLWHYSEHVLFTTAHNDFIQWTFETGLVGLGALGWLLIDSLWIASKKGERPFYSLIGLIVFAAFFFPLEMPSMQMLWIYFIQRQLRRPYGSTPHPKAIRV